MNNDLRLYAKLLRRELRRLHQVLRYRRSLIGAPVLFGNSFPKSGTHLLTQVLQAFPRLGIAVDSGLPAIVMYDSHSGAERPVEVILAELRRLKAGDIAYGHLHALPPLVEFLCGEGVIPYFILRDPRDVAVSHVHYITAMTNHHIHHRYYSEVLQSFDERLRVSICGLDGQTVYGMKVPFPNIAERFAPFLGWLERPEVLTLRYEDFLVDRRTALKRILSHALRRGFRLAGLSEQDMERVSEDTLQTSLQVLESAIDPRRSPTFRRGVAGGWREAFSEENKRLFKEVAGDLLIRLEYERDYDW